MSGYRALFAVSRVSVTGFNDLFRLKKHRIGLSYQTDKIDRAFGLELACIFSGVFASENRKCLASPTKERVELLMNGQTDRNQPLNAYPVVDQKWVLHSDLEDRFLPIPTVRQYGSLLCLAHMADLLYLGELSSSENSQIRYRPNLCGDGLSIRLLSQLIPVSTSKCLALSD